MQGTWVQILVRELGPQCRDQEDACSKEDPAESEGKKNQCVPCMFIHILCTYGNIFLQETETYRFYSAFFT